MPRFNWFLVLDFPIKIIDGNGKRWVVDYMVDVANVGNEFIQNESSLAVEW